MRNPLADHDRATPRPDEPELSLDRRGNTRCSAQWPGQSEPGPGGQGSGKQIPAR